MNVTYNVFYKSEWLHNLINEFGYDDKRLQKLGSFLKFLRVKKTHLKKVRKDGTTDAPTGTIWGLASPGDGTKDSENRNLPHPPYIKSVGAGPKDVKFWDGEANIYITVYDYFRQRKSFPNLPNCLSYRWTSYRVKLTSTRVRPHPPTRGYASPEYWLTTETRVRAG